MYVTKLQQLTTILHTREREREGLYVNVPNIKYITRIEQKQSMGNRGKKGGQEVFFYKEQKKTQA